MVPEASPPINRLAGAEAFVWIQDPWMLVGDLGCIVSYKYSAVNAVRSHTLFCQAAFDILCKSIALDLGKMSRANETAHVFSPLFNYVSFVYV